MMLKNEYMPDEVSVPGESLADILEERGMPQVELARRVGHAEKTISEIIHGKAPITPEMAVKLETVLGVPARFWNMRQAQYQDSEVRREQERHLEGYMEWVHQFPYAEMMRRGWLAARETPLERLRELLRFFGFASPKEYESYWQDFWATATVSLRTSPTFKNVQGSLAVWLRQGELEAQHIECAPYNEQAFRRALQDICRLTTKDSSTYQTEIVKLCADAGVAVVFVPELVGMRASGAARWLTSEKALIQICLRYKTDDQLWFTFFHEAGHILLDGKRQIFVDTGIDTKDEKEARASKFAADILIPPDKLRAFLATDRGRNLSTMDIERFADELGIAPGIIVGRLQHDEIVPFKNHNMLKKKLEWLVPN
jgi:HTH-type transcriptional regulator/antitoxin HigA